MLRKLFNAKPKNSHSGVMKQEYAKYCQDLEQTLSTLEANLHSSDDPEEIAMMALKTACEFYQADWAGLLEVDLNLNLWSPAWWYNAGPDDKTLSLINEFESAEFLHRWVAALRQNHAIIVPDTKLVKEDWPDEYLLYQRMEAHSIMGVPIKPRPTGFLVIRNPQRYLTQSSMLQMLAFVVLSNYNEKKLLDSAKMALTPDAIECDKDIIINFLGNMEICTSKGVLREQDFKAPKCARVATYLMLHRKAAHPPLEIAAALWPNDHSTPEAISSNIRGLIYRFRQAFSMVSDYPLIEATPNGYRLNPELHIMTDLQQFDRLWDAIQHTSSTSRKIDLLKQAISIYRGPLFENACDEHWILGMVNNYNLRYVGLINELLMKLSEAGDYQGVQHYATKSLEIVPENVTARYWLVHATYHLGAIELAKNEIERSKKDLTADEYKLLLNLLRNDTKLSAEQLFFE